MKRSEIPSCRGEEDQIAALAPWFHNLHLPDGSQTAPDHFLGDFPRYKWQELAPHLPADLHGWTALDIGCNAGYYSFELARRGAEVTAIDCSTHYLRQARWAAGQYGLQQRIRFVHQQVYALARQPQCFDLVLFLGVFYHLRYPLLALDIVARKARKLLVFQSMAIPGDETPADTNNRAFGERASMRDPGWPKMAFIEDRFADDPTNWWVPNRAAIEPLLRSSGLRVVARPGTEVFLCEPDPQFVPVAPEHQAEFDAAVGALLPQR